MRKTQIKWTYVQRFSIKISQKLKMQPQPLAPTTVVREHVAAENAKRK